MIDRLIAMSTSALMRMSLVSLLVLGTQTTILNEIRPFGVCVQAMLLMSACAGLAKGSEVGAISGFLLGFMYDMVLVTPLGLSGVVFAVAGYLAGFANNFAHESTWWSRMLIGPAACVIGAFLMPLALLMVGIDGALTTEVFRVAAVVGVSSIVLTEPMVRVCGWALGGTKEPAVI